MTEHGTSSPGGGGGVPHRRKTHPGHGKNPGRTRRTGAASPSQARPSKRVAKRQLKRVLKGAARGSPKRVTEGTTPRQLKRVTKGAAERSLKPVTKRTGSRGAGGERSMEKRASRARNRRSSVDGGSGGAGAEKGQSVRTITAKRQSVRTTTAKGQSVKADRSGRRPAKTSPATVGDKREQNKSHPRKTTRSSSRKSRSNTRRRAMKDPGSKTARGTVKRGNSSGSPNRLLASCFSGLGRRRPPDGLGVVVGVVETVGGQIDATVIARDRLGNLGPRRGATGTSILAPARLGGSGSKSARLLGTALAAMGHPVRIKILTMLLDGPGVYRSLQKVTGLKPGPLYHHVNQLRLAGLIGPKQRDLYELTRAGRNLLMVTLALEPLLKDRRLRPQAKA